MANESKTIAELWMAAYDAEQACRWSEAAELYEQGILRFKVGESALNQRTLDRRIESRDLCRSFAAAEGGAR